MRAKHKRAAAQPSTKVPVPAKRRLSWLQRVQGLKSYPPHPEPKPVPTNIYDHWQGLVPEYARAEASMSLDQIEAVAATIPQHLRDDEAAIFGTPRGNSAQPELVRKERSETPQPKPQKKAKLHSKRIPRKGGRPSGITPAAIRSAETTIKMMNDGDQLKDVAVKRERNYLSLKSELYRYRLSLRKNSKGAKRVQK